MSILILPKKMAQEEKVSPNIFQKNKNEQKIRDNSILRKNFGVINYMRRKVHIRGTKPNLLTRLKCHAHAVYWHQ